MNLLDSLGRLLLACGTALLILGSVLLVLGRIPALGRLPGDFQLRWGDISCQVPLMTGLVLSIIATVVLNLILWLLRK